MNYTSLSLNLTNADYLFAAFVIAAYGSSRPNEETVEEVMNDLQENNTDFSQLVEWKADHYEQAESSTEGGCSA